MGPSPLGGAGTRSIRQRSVPTGVFRMLGSSADTEDAVQDTLIRYSAKSIHSLRTMSTKKPGCCG